MKETKEIILETAYNLFLYNNYEAVTINSIIKATGLTKGGIYYYYASKEEIFKAVVDKYMFENRADNSVEYANLKELIQSSINAAEEKIRKRIDENAGQKNEIPINYLSLMLAAYRYYPGFAELGNEFINSQFEKWEKVIRKAIENGEIRNDIDIQATIANFMQISSGIVGSMIMGGSMVFALEMYERQNWELYKCIQK